ncbi:hypothetical protein [Streptomyces roseochromogenus]|uniref:Holin n=1 Tax=Streptomyces roseochromogenus subsp. oscitans DS 12.976 TaxID=1352936 RepID=V6JZ40_STRRC|nr:hypothetical protein [Streptomyces roseochromogenus]EST24401.1 hypothetical protein M878_30785 [Streptomyces roseochromogenus subsp. oscitans DS 12.976]
MMNAPVEKKVQASTVVGLVVGVLVTLANSLAGHSELMGSVPAWLQSLITLDVPPLATFLAGWLAPHTSRAAPAPEPPAVAPVDAPKVTG